MLASLESYRAVLAVRRQEEDRIEEAARMLSELGWRVMPPATQSSEWACLDSTSAVESLECFEPEGN